MARRYTSRRRRSSIAKNRRRHKRFSRPSAARRLIRNVFGADVVNDVVIPVAGGTAGFVGARALGNMIAMRGWGTSEPRVGKTIAAAVGIPAVLALGARMPGGMLARNAGMVALGMGLAATEAWLRDTPLLGGSRAAAAVTADLPAVQPSLPAAESSGDGTSGLSAYYTYPTDRSGHAMSDDYYTAGMLSGNDPADQGAVEQSLDEMESPESVSIVTPTDVAREAGVMPQTMPIDEPFAGGDKGYAGGVFARHLFSGMMGG